MDITASVVNSTHNTALSNAVVGLQDQSQRFEKNVEEVATASNTSSRDSNSQDKALVEQQEIVNNFRSNAAALRASNEVIGTIIDIDV